jgi:metallo-beta-lactamase family protein
MEREIRTTTREHATADARIELLGAWRTVTGAMTRVDYAARPGVAAGAVLVDCGTAQGHDRGSCAGIDEALTAGSGPQAVGAVILTHGHHDHVGRLPELFGAGYAGPIYGTRATLALAELNVRDSLGLAGASEREMAGFVAAFRAHARPLRYDEPVELAGAGRARLTLREAGHILGSASVELTTAASRIVLSGDLGRPGTPLLRDPFTAWGNEREVDLVVMESTYGAREHACSHGQARVKLREIVRRTIARRGHLLIPAFAIGRTQTILYLLNELVESGELPPVPVAVDTPLGLRVTELYQEDWKLFDAEALARIACGDDPLDFNELYAVNRARDSHRLHEMPGPMVIIAGSGMCTGGRIVQHLIDLLPHEETAVLLVGYQAPGTPGGAIQRARPGDTVELDGRRIHMGATVETLSGLSAHADRTELGDWLAHIPGACRVALHHGDPQAQEALAQWLAR